MPRKETRLSRSQHRLIVAFKFSFCSSSAIYRRIRIEGVFEFQQAQIHVSPVPNVAAPRFDYGIMVGFGLRLKTHFTWLPRVVELVFTVREWRNVNHHAAWLRSL